MLFKQKKGRGKIASACLVRLKGMKKKKKKKKVEVIFLCREGRENLGVNKRNDVKVERKERGNFR